MMQSNMPDDAINRVYHPKLKLRISTDSERSCSSRATVPSNFVSKDIITSAPFARECVEEGSTDDETLYWKSLSSSHCAFKNDDHSLDKPTLISEGYSSDLETTKIKMLETETFNKSFEKQKSIDVFAQELSKLRRTQSGPPDQYGYNDPLRRMFSDLSSSRSVVSDAKALCATEEDRCNAQAWFAPFCQWHSRLTRVGSPPVFVPAEATGTPWLQLKPSEQFAMDSETRASYLLRPVAWFNPILPKIRMWLCTSLCLIDPFTKREFYRVRGSTRYVVAADNAEIYSLQQLEPPPLRPSVSIRQPPSSWFFSACSSSQSACRPAV